MNYQVTRTKIIPPRRRADLLSRQRLLDTLYEFLDFKLIILIAPAGYGKTFLLVDFAQSTELPACWYALDPLDRDLHRFFVHFIAAIAERFPDFGRASTAALESLANGQGAIEQLVATIVNDLYEHVREHFVFVIDDFFLVEDNPAINLFISQFVQQVDENCHIVLASRKLLSIPDMALMIARGYVGGMDFEDLAFAPQELQALTQKNYGYQMADAEAAALVEATDGWIIGLLLSAQSKLRSISGRMRLMRASGLDLYDYLAEQVLNQQPEVIRDFLLRTALLEEFDADLCAAILGEAWRPPDQSWHNLIDEVLRRNLFVLPLGEDSAWLRYNHVFQDFLQKRLMKVRPEEEKMILERLAAYYQQQEDWEKAHYYINRMGDLGAIAALLERAGLALLYGGRIALLSTWLSQLPPDFLRERPALQSLYGAVIVRQDNPKQGLALLNEAATALQATGDLPHLAHTLVRRAVVHRLLGDYQAALADADQVLHLLPATATLDAAAARARVLALRSKGLSFYAMGKPALGLPHLQAALTAYQLLDDSYNIALTTQDIALSYLQLGQYSNALPGFERALAAWRNHDNLSGQALVLNNMGYLFSLQGKHEQALTHLEEALTCAQRSGYTRIVCYALLSIGDLFADLDLWEAALEVYEQAMPIVRQRNEQVLLLSLELALARLASFTADWEGAFLHLDSASKLVMEQKSGYEWGLYQLTVGRCYLAQTKAAEAIVPLHEALTHFDQASQPIEVACTQLLLAAALYTAKGANAPLHLRQGLDLAASLESRYMVLTIMRSLRLYWQNRKALAADSRLATWLEEVERVEQIIPKQSRQLRKIASPMLASLLVQPPAFVIRALGRVEVTVNGKSITNSDWQTIISRDLFLCLLAHPEGLTKEAIGAIFWPDAGPAELKTRFKNAIYRLRNALRQDVVLYTNDFYHYNWAIDYQYDVEEFLQKVGEGDRCNVPAQKVERYQAAVMLYRGAYLPDVDASWAWSTREHLQRIFIDTALSLAQLYFAQQDYGPALEVCQRVLAEDPCMEDAHRLAMRIHAALGNRADVARQFALCQKILLEEVDAPPSPQTEELYATLMQ